MAGGHNVPAMHFFFAKKSQFLYETLDFCVLVWHKSIYGS